MKMTQAVALVLLGGIPSFAQNKRVIELNPSSTRVIESQAFTVTESVPISITCTGATTEDEDILLAFGWILDAKTRKPVWQMSEKGKGRRSGEFRILKTSETVDLEPGKYIAHFAVSPNPMQEYTSRRWGKIIISGILKKSEFDRWYRYSRDCGMTIDVDASRQGMINLTGLEEPEDALFAMVRLENSDNRQKAFELTEDAQVRIYAVGEGQRDEMFDFCWIVDETTGEEVWRMEYDDTEWAGGAEKNRVMDRTLRLKKGKYILSAMTDDSHSFEKWNLLPPLDPDSWGVTVWPAEEGINMGVAVRGLLKDYVPDSERHSIVSMIRIGDDYSGIEGFTLKMASRVRIRCLGERNYSEGWADEGWITDAKTDRRVWQMTMSNTRHAGGASKNRMFDGVVVLEPGNYFVNYITDDSHSYQDWNSDAPFDPKAWGIEVWGVGEDFDPGAVSTYEPEKDPEILVQLVRVRDDERVFKRFVLDKPTLVRIHAVGEGTGGDMDDYGWIENNDTGRKVWRMDYEETEHAGGAGKNREVNMVIRLDAGEYTAVYRTDGSHAFGDWNSDPPDNPAQWGLTIRYEH